MRVCVFSKFIDHLSILKQLHTGLVRQPCRRVAVSKPCDCQKAWLGKALPAAGVWALQRGNRGTK